MCKKDEALKRMRMLNIIESAVIEFENYKVVNKSVTGILFHLDDTEKQMVKEFEKEHNALVYHVIMNYTDCGIMYSLLYVSNHKEEWEMDIEDIKNNRAFVYVKNVTCEDFSEFGSIGIKSVVGGVIRTS